MKLARLTGLLTALVTLTLGGASRSAAAADDKTIETTVCELVVHPERYSGKMVSFRAELIAVRRFILAPRRTQVGDDVCGRVLLNYPSNPDVAPKARFRLERDEAFNTFHRSLHVLGAPPTHLPGQLIATFEGRFDSVYILRRGRRSMRNPDAIMLAPGEGRLVLRRITDVEIVPSRPR